MIMIDNLKFVVGKPLSTNWYRDGGFVFHHISHLEKWGDWEQKVGRLLSTSTPTVVSLPKTKSYKFQVYYLFGQSCASAPRNEMTLRQNFTFWSPSRHRLHRFSRFRISGISTIAGGRCRWPVVGRMGLDLVETVRFFTEPQRNSETFEEFKFFQVSGARNCETVSLNILEGMNLKLEKISLSNILPFFNVH